MIESEIVYEQSHVTVLALRGDTLHEQGLIDVTHHTVYAGRAQPQTDVQAQQPFLATNL